MKTVIYWLRNDLSVNNNVILYSKLNTFKKLIPFYIYDKRFDEKHGLGFNSFGDLRKKCLAESLVDLQNDLQKLNSDLIVKSVNPEIIVLNLILENSANIVYATKELTSEEILTEKRLKKNLGSVPIRFFEQLTLFYPDYLPFKISNIPDIFSKFRKSVENEAKVRSPFDIPKELPPLPNHNFKNDINRVYKIVESGVKTDPRSAFLFSGREFQG